MQLFFLSVFFAAMMSSCRALPKVDGENTSEPKLVGGTSADKSAFPAAVFLGNCTGTRVGTRWILTSAHCVIDEELKLVEPEYSNGAKIELTYGANIKLGPKVKLDVKAVYVHPTYITEVVKAGKTEMTSEQRDRLADVALVEFDEGSLPVELATATISDRSFSTGGRIVIAGYGCQIWLFRWLQQMAAAKLAAGKLKPSGSLPTNLPVLVPQDPSPFEASNLMWARTKVSGTSGANINFLDTKKNSPESKDFGLCEGDSGGAVYVDDDTGPTPDGKPHAFLKVGGVNSFGVPGIWSGFSRVDDEGMWRVTSCLNAAMLGKAPVDLPKGTLPAMCVLRDLPKKK